MRERQELSPQELRREADKADEAADRIFQDIEENPDLLKPSYTDDYEPIPSPALTAAGGLRQVARNWMRQAEAIEKVRGESK